MVLLDVFCCLAGVFSLAVTYVHVAVANGTFGGK